MIGQSTTYDNVGRALLFCIKNAFYSLIFLDNTIGHFKNFYRIQSKISKYNMLWLIAIDFSLYGMNFYAC